METNEPIPIQLPIILPVRLAINPNNIYQGSKKFSLAKVNTENVVDGNIYYAESGNLLGKARQRITLDGKINGTEYAKPIGINIIEKINSWINNQLKSDEPSDLLKFYVNGPPDKYNQSPDNIKRIKEIKNQILEEILNQTGEPVDKEYVIHLIKEKFKNEQNKINQEAKKQIEENNQSLKPKQRYFPFFNSNEPKFRPKFRENFYQNLLNKVNEVNIDSTSDMYYLFDETPFTKRGIPYNYNEIAYLVTEPIPPEYGGKRKKRKSIKKKKNVKKRKNTKRKRI